MTRNQKINGVIFTTAMCLIFIDIIWKNHSLDKKLSNCSFYTIGEPTKVYMLRGGVWVKYKYTINSIVINSEDGVGPNDTHEWWTIDMEKLKNRRLMLQVYCDDLNENRILWDVPVPDTLQFIPPNGWKEIPYGLGDGVEK
jgi:hypothetical protein